MNFKVGDKVNFLNDQGGGIVTKIIDDTLVHVTIEDGFEIPVLSKELIKTGTAELSADITRAHERITALKNEPEHYEEDDILPLYLSHNNPDQRAEGLYFCFVPEIQDNPLSGSLEVHLINHTKYTSVFGFFLNHSGDYHGEEYGYIEAHSRLQLATIGRSEIEKWANALWQSVFFSEGKCRPLPPYSGLINFRPIKLYKEESFQFESLLRKKAFFTEVVLVSQMHQKPLLDEKISQETLKNLETKIKSEGTASQTQSRQVKESFLEKHKIDDKIAEVDLHIGELVDNFTNLENSDMLNLQVDYFRKCLQQAEKERLSKVIFIHGIGNGKLKTEINKALQGGKGIEYYDAPYARYGMGATEVNFYRNK